MRSCLHCTSGDAVAFMYKKTRCGVGWGGVGVIGFFLTLVAPHVVDRSGGAKRRRPRPERRLFLTMTDQPGEPDREQCLKTDLLSAP